MYLAYVTQDTTSCLVNIKYLRLDEVVVDGGTDRSTRPPQNSVFATSWQSSTVPKIHFFFCSLFSLLMEGGESVNLLTARDGIVGTFCLNLVALSLIYQPWIEGNLDVGVQVLIGSIQLWVCIYFKQILNNYFQPQKPTEILDPMCGSFHPNQFNGKNFRHVEA